MKKYLPLLFIICLGGRAAAQPESGGILYEHEHNIGVLAHTKGIGLSFEFSHYTASDRYRLLEFSLYSLRHPKEVKLPNPILGSSRPYVFGKQYAPVMLQAAIGQRRVLADKIFTQNVRVNLNVTVGPTLAVLKPVYYEVTVPNPEPQQTTTKYARFDPEDVNMHNNTVGAASFFKGIGESGFMPGGNANASLSFEWGPLDYRFYSLETGVMVNAFPMDLPIFAYENTNDKIFINLFLALSYGVRK